jgi:ankyrin repeat protein
MVELLLANKANVNDGDNSGCAPLLWAAALGHKDVAELLIANGANVDALTNNGETPLHRAIVKGHKDVADLLREHGGHDIGSNFFSREWNHP